MGSLSLTPRTARQSQIAYVVAKLMVRGQECLLLNAHHKWGDWSLLGGHVEADDASWWEAAAREAQEELAPLKCGAEMEIKREELAASEWGPIASASAGGAPTRYQARWFSLRFLEDPKQCLARLPREEFRLVPLSALNAGCEVASVVTKIAQLLPDGWRSLPLSWDADLDDVPLRAS
jgi:hypothetical protein